MKFNGELDWSAPFIHHENKKAKLKEEGES
jgi:hypothetical protein